MNTLYWVAQIFGAAAIIDSFIIFQQTDRRRLLALKMLQDICWLTHYLMLSAFSAAATSAICFFRGIVFYNNSKKWASSKWWLFGFITLYAVSAVLTWEDIFCIFPALSSTLSAIAFWVKDTRNTKLISIGASSSTLVYNITHSRSIPVYIGIAMTISSSIISLIRTAKSKKRQY